MELVESQPLLEWLANNYKTFGATLEIITDKSQEGSQFVRGFGGIGGLYILEMHLLCILIIVFIIRYPALQSRFAKFTRRRLLG